MAIYQRTVNSELSGDQTIITNARHLSSLQEIQVSVQKIIQCIETSIPGDLLAQDLRLALDGLGEITGTISTDDLLANIFSKFCIGK